MPHRLIAATIAGLALFAMLSFKNNSPISQKKAELVELVKSENACVVLNGNPNIIQLEQIWDCDKAEKLVDENFKIVRWATFEDLNFDYWNYEKGRN